MKNNPIFQVLVATNAALLAVNKRPHELAVGQLGIFNVDTGLSVTAALPANFKLGLGVGTGGTLSDVRFSAGEHIKKALINTVYSKHPETAADQVYTLDLTSFTPKFDTDYTVRINFMSGQTLQIHGFDHPSKSFVVHTPCVGDCTGDMDLGDFIDLVVAEVNADPEGLVVAANVTDTSITFTVKAEPFVSVVGGINPRYSFLRQFTCTFAFTGGFDAGGYTGTNVPAVFAQGLGYDLAIAEAIAGGWNGKPGIYRLSELNDVFFGTTEINAVATKKYWTMRINHGYPSNSGGMLNYVNAMETVIAIEDLFANKVTFMDALNTLFGSAGAIVPLDAPGKYETTELLA